MMKKVLAGAVALLFVALLGYRVAAARNDTQARAEDRAQIENLMWNYSHAVYTGNSDAYAALFTPDGQFGTGAQAVKGRAALKKMINKMDVDLRKTGQPFVYIMDLDTQAEFSDPNHARLEAYFLEVSPRTGPNGPAQVVDAGREVDELERVNSQWLIQLRNITP
jgi:hypothetical protein